MSASQFPPMSAFVLFNSEDASDARWATGHCEFIDPWGDEVTVVQVWPVHDAQAHRGGLCTRDVKPHDTMSMCWCQAEVERLENGQWLVSHTRAEPDEQST